MPFTLSHAAASLPFRRCKPVWPALVIGTFAPDLQYFILISDEDRGWHRLPDVLLLALPCALVALWMFESFCKRSAIALLPSSIERRLKGKTDSLVFLGWRQFASIVFWICVGIATHLSWDQFTHSYSDLALRWDALRMVVPLPLGHSIQFAHLLQHVSTVGGIAVLAAWFTAWYRRTVPAAKGDDQFSPRLKITLLVGMASVAALLGYPVAVLRLARPVHPTKQLHLVVTAFEAMTLVFGLELLIFGLAMTLNTRLRRRAVQVDEAGD
jgi:Domain of unknown function (DUF4184)